MNAADQQTAAEVAKAVAPYAMKLIRSGFSPSDAFAVALDDYRQFAREMAAQRTERSRRLMREQAGRALDQVWHQLNGVAA